MKQSKYLWCISYDQESYHRTFLKINFSRFLNMLLSNKYFSQFQQQAAKQLKQPQLWPRACWAILQFYQCINQIFDIQKIDSKVGFIQDNILRKTLGHFRLWIDLERIYLLCFLKLDRVNFQQQRIFMSIFRILKFFGFFFSQYEFGDFQPTFIEQLKNGAIPKLKYLRQCVAQQCFQMTDKVIDMLSCFVQNKNYIDSNRQNTYQKRVYQKITHQYSLLPQVQRRLHFNIDYLQKQRTRREVARLQEININMDYLQPLFDPQKKLIRQFKNEMDKKNESYDEQKINLMLEQYKKKTKNRKSTENIYSSLMKIGHNPYDSDNFRTYGQLLGIDISKKQQLQKVQVKSNSVATSDSSQLIYYTSQFSDSLQNINLKSARVKQEDLTNLQMSTGSDNLFRAMGFSQKISSPKWNYKEKSQKPQSTGRKNLSTRDQFTNLQRNVILKDDDQQEANSFKQQIFKSLFFKFKSGTLNSIEARSTKYNQPPNIKAYNKQRNKNLLLLNKKAIKSHDKLEYLRQVNKFSVIQSKIKKIMMEKQVPDFYPRHYQDFSVQYSDVCKQKNRKLKLFDIKFYS